jgi:arabinogalactan endo-1,4-beta-galactosidase
MKKTLLTLMTTLVITAATAQKKFVGGDISMLTKYERAGVVYRDKNGKTVSDVLAFFKQEGMNAMRVRLFVDPSLISDKAVCQDLSYVKALGKRIKDHGLKLMLDFHYSDTWADPGNQWTPDAWKNLSDAELYEKIYDYTKECLEAMVAAGATPDFIQTGNEISYGMLWGTQAAVGSNNVNRCYTSSSTNNWNRFFNLLKQAGKACREVCPDAKIILHSERVPKTNVLADYFNRMKRNSIDYDIIGLSYYPDHHGGLNQLEGALNILENNNYGKDIMIVETGYGYKWSIGSEYDYTGTYPLTEEGQRQFTADLITKLNAHSSVTGLFWWWPEDNGNKNVTDGWWNAGLYNHSNGKPYAALYELKNFAPVEAVTGDLNGDGLVNALDIQLEINAAAAGSTEAVYDINEDGTVNALDIQTVINIAASTPA